MMSPCWCKALESAPPPTCVLMWAAGDLSHAPPLPVAGVPDGSAQPASVLPGSLRRRAAEVDALAV